MMAVSLSVCVANVSLVCVQTMLLEIVLPFVLAGIMIGWYSLYTIHVAAAIIPTILFVLALAAWEYNRRRNRRLARMATKQPPGHIEAYFMKLTRRQQREHTATASSIEVTTVGVERDTEFAATDEYTARF